MKFSFNILRAFLPHVRRACGPRLAGREQVFVAERSPLPRLLVQTRRRTHESTHLPAAGPPTDWLARLDPESLQEALKLDGRPRQLLRRPLGVDGPVRSLLGGAGHTRDVLRDLRRPTSRARHVLGDLVERRRLNLDRAGDRRLDVAYSPDDRRDLLDRGDGAPGILLDRLDTPVPETPRAGRESPSRRDR